MIGEISLVGAGPGDPELLTLKALRLIEQADWVVYDRLVSDAVLELIPSSAQRLYVGKTPYGSFTPQSVICERILELAKAGNRVCRLKGGDPFVFGRGGEEQAAILDAGIPCEVVPGISAAFASGAVAGIPLTHRGVSQGLTILTGHMTTSIDYDWTALASLGHTLVFYMGVKQCIEIQENLIAAGMYEQMPVAVIERATLPDQRIIRGTLEGLAELVETQAVQSPALLVIGEVVDLAAVASANPQHVQRRHEPLRCVKPQAGRHAAPA